MTVIVQFQDDHDAVALERLEQLSALCQTIAAHMSLCQGELSVRFVEDETMKQLNAEYRNKDQTTDVLSFPMLDEEELESLVEEASSAENEGQTILLGDIIISIPQAKAQAVEFGHSFDRELGFLLVHGFLHLIGYEHETLSQEQEMFALQEKILSEHGLVR